MEIGGVAEGRNKSQTASIGKEQKRREAKKKTHPFDKQATRTKTKKTHNSRYMYEEGRGRIQSGINFAKRSASHSCTSARAVKLPPPPPFSCFLILSSRPLLRHGPPSVFLSTSTLHPVRAQIRYPVLMQNKNLTKKLQASMLTKDTYRDDGPSLTEASLA